MLRKILGLFSGGKPEETVEAKPSHHNHHNIMNTLFRRQKQEIIEVEFLKDCACYDTNHDTIFAQTIKAGIYRLRKDSLNDASHNQLPWYFIEGETRGMTELTLHRLIESGAARIVKH